MHDSTFGVSVFCFTLAGGFIFLIFFFGADFTVIEMLLNFLS